FIKIHILHHAQNQEIYGAWMIEELKEHGYKISPGAIYPIFKSLEKKQLLKARYEQKGKIKRRWYKCTPKGKRELAKAKIKLKELIGEILD
ncbi:MAG: PadR family transcriptional regulator, partial [Halobacteriovoraceae bacterium]|nr:PadR family transcriptional regulator [Halobacteriovoraceae bacterium]